MGLVTYKSSIASHKLQLTLVGLYSLLSVLILFIGLFILQNNLFVYGDITLKDPELRIQLVAKDLKFPTSMAFLAMDDMLVLEKDGLVRRILGENTLEVPVLNISSNINSTRERGLLGIAISTEHQLDSKYTTGESASRIYLYFTQKIPNKVIHKDCDIKMCNKDHRTVNSLYRYDMKEGRLVNPKLVISVPFGTGDVGIEHIGGAITLGPDERIYITSGDGYPCRSYEDCKNNMNEGVLNTKTANSKYGNNASGFGGILVVPQDPEDNINNPILGGDFPLNLYYAYGIRNSFGLDFDPITKDLWDTENGPFFGDEMNLVKPGFNSGWTEVQGIWPITNHNLRVKDLPTGYIFPKINSEIDPDTLFDFNGNGKYSSPEFTWNDSIGVTGIKFYNSDKLSKKYENDIFVGAFSKGFLYHFDLNKERTGLLTAPDDDNVADREELEHFIFGSGFYGVTDIEVSPDGFLYILSFTQGEIWKIVPTEIKIDR